MAIQTATQTQLLPALRLAFGDLSEELMKHRLLATLNEYARNAKLFDGLLVCARADTVEGVIWVVEMPGRTGVTGLPRLRGTDSNHAESGGQAIQPLLAAANEFADRQPLSLNQIVLDPAQFAAWQEDLQKGGYSITISLDYFEKGNLADSSAAAGRLPSTTDETDRQQQSSDVRLVPHR